MCLESKKSQQDLFADNTNIPKSYLEMSKPIHEPDHKIIYPLPERECIMNMQSGTDYH